MRWLNNLKVGKKLTKEIAEIINDVQNKTNSAVSVMNENSKEVDKCLLH